MLNRTPPRTAALALLRRMKDNGIDYLFANGGTDFAPILEAYAEDPSGLPEPLVIPHETAAIAMAHGYYLLTGRPQAAMVHVNVGLANCLMGLINCASENIPLLMLAGRTPLTEGQRLGSRMTPVQYGQEMRDQSAMLREVVKWDYELRYGEQVVDLVDRAMAIAQADPQGPVYLGLPREPLTDAWPTDLPADRPIQAVPTPPAPNPAAIAQAAQWLARAERPLILCQRGDVAGQLSAALDELCRRHTLPVVEFWPISNVLPSDHPCLMGYEPKTWLNQADVILCLDSLVPWVQRNMAPPDDCRVIHLGSDPLFQKLPVRGYRNDLAITADRVAGICALTEAMDGLGVDNSPRLEELERLNAVWREKGRALAAEGGGSPMTPAFVSQALSEVINREDGILINEMGADAPCMHLPRANCYLRPPLSGGLGWGMPAGLGALLADRDRLVISCIGDGSYIFANPVACHQIAESLGLPLLTVVMNNGVWEAVRRAARVVYPDGHAKRANDMVISSLEPSPDYTAIAGASRGWAARVESGDALAATLAEAVRVVRQEKRQALVEVRVRT